MDFAYDRTSNQHIIDYSDYLLEVYPDRQEEIEEFVLAWIETGAMPDLLDFLGLN